jgi:hypothetical protein
VIGRLLLAVVGRLFSQSADGIVVKKTVGTACSSLMLADDVCSSVKLYEAREWIRLVPN